MNPIRTATGLVQLPAHAAAAVAGTAVGVAGTAVRAVARVAGHVASRAAGPAPQPRVLVPRDVERPAATPAASKAARRAPSRKAAVVAPALGLTASEAEDVLRTPSGIPAAGDGTNPDTTETDLHQPGTEPLMDPSTTKAVASEAEVLQRAADVDKG